MLRHWHGLARGGIGLGSAYLHSTGVLDADNQAPLRFIAGVVKAWRRPFILAGDWQVAPEVLEESGWPALMRARIVHTNSKTYSSGGHASHLDYFLVEESLLTAVV